jgi:hypothetical protein
MVVKKGLTTKDWENASDFSAPTVFYRTLDVEGLEIFYREAGPGMVQPFSSCTAFPRLLICSAI